MINTAPYIIDFFNVVVWASDDGVRKSEIAAAHLKLGIWKFESEQWNFAVDYIGKNHITNIGIISKPKVGYGLLYNNRTNVALVSLLDNHKWAMS